MIGLRCLVISSCTDRTLQLFSLPAKYRKKGALKKNSRNAAGDGSNFPIHPNGAGLYSDRCVMEKAILLAAILLVFTTEFVTCQEECKAIADCDGEVKWMKWPSNFAVTVVEDEPPQLITVADERQEGPKLYYFANTLTWSSGKSFCATFNRRLCRSEELCVEGNHGRHFLFDVIPGDNWVPVLDTANEWVEIGDSLRRTCYKHGPRYGPPPWGLTTATRPYKGFVYCCPQPEEDRETGMRYQYIGNSATYASSRQHCERQDLRLCSSVEVCQRNSPVFGVVRGDMWVAVNDRDNEWVEVGDSHDRTCWIHGLHYGPPPWGIRTDETLVQHVGYVYCCEDDDEQ